MPIRPFLVLYRKRLLSAALVSLASTLLFFFWTTAESPLDIGILWHHFCGCPPDPADTLVLLNGPTFTCFVLGMLLGISPIRSAATVGNTSVQSEFSILFTRPASRIILYLTPVLVATFAIVLFPAACMLLLLGWLALVHAPALGHLLDLVRLIPSAAAIGPHPSLIAVLSACHFPLRYLASVSLGMCSFAAFFSQRWLLRSSNKWARIGATLPAFFGMVPAVTLVSRTLGSSIMLLPAKSAGLRYLPSPTLIALHYVFAFACLYGCWRIARSAEI